MKNNTFFKLFIIIILALILRLWFIDKPEGLWNDEYFGWLIASQKDWNKFFEYVFNNCHTPFYYFYLKAWLLIFPDTDVSLRLSSVLPSILSIPVMFVIGKKIRDINTGLLAAILTAISSFNIYFAQEMRLYSLLFLFSALVILFFIKSLQEKSRFSIFMYFFFNALLCATHTLGIIFSFFNIAALIYCLFGEKESFKDKLKALLRLSKYIIPFIIVLILLCPLLVSIATSKSLYQFWSDFSIAKIFFTFMDYFSPIQTNISTSPDSISAYMYFNSKINYQFIIFGVLPLIIAIIGIIKCISNKNKLINVLLITSGLFYLTLICFSLMGKMVLSTKYSIEMYPVLIIAATVGLLSFKRDSIKNILIILFIGLNLTYIIESPTSAPKQTRPEGHRAVVELIKNSRLKPHEKVILTYYNTDKFERYMPDTSIYDFHSIDKFNFNYVMFNNDNYYQTIHYGKVLYKSFFKTFPNDVLQKYSYDHFKTPLKKGDRLGLIYLNNVAFLSVEEVKNIAQDEKRYNKTPFIFLVFSSLKNNIMYSVKNEFKIDSITQSGDWTLIVYEKII